MKTKNTLKNNPKFFWILISSFLLILLLSQAENIMEKIVHQNKEVIVPDLTGIPFEEATKILEKQKLGIEQESEIFDKDIEIGSVVSQFPLQNSTVRQGRIIKIILSKSENSFEMPSVIGFSQREAEAELKNAGCTLGEIAFAYSSSIKNGNVISQNPRALSIISRGAFVNLKISKGLPPMDVKLMPKVIGLKKDEIKILLQSLGLEVAFELVKTENPTEKGTAIAQTPDIDEELSDGQTAYIKIGE